jgi:hypothetical protein
MVTPEKKKNRGRGLIEGSSGQPDEDEWRESRPWMNGERAGPRLVSNSLPNSNM